MALGFERDVHAKTNQPPISGVGRDGPLTTGFDERVRGALQVLLYRVQVVPDRVEVDTSRLDLAASKTLASPKSCLPQQHFCSHALHEASIASSTRRVLLLKR